MLEEVAVSGRVVFSCVSSRGRTVVTALYRLVSCPSCRRRTAGDTPFNGPIERYLSETLRVYRNVNFGAHGFSKCMNATSFSRGRPVLNVLNRLSIIPRNAN